MAPNPITTPAPTMKELNQELLICALGEKLKAVEVDMKSLQDSVKLKNEKIIKLEAENVRLKMQRTDAELQGRVDGLRIEVGKKDRELVDLKRRIGILQGDEASILRRAASAEQKIALQQTTMETMQKARDAAHLEREKHDQDRLEAVKKSIDFEDRLKVATARIAELEGKTGKPKPFVKPSQFFREKKK